jgi:2-methylcitrate dehydratase PrpD
MTSRVVTKKIAEFISDIKFGDIPSEAFELARKGILDFIGVALAGSKEGIGTSITEWARETGGTELSGVIGKGFRTSPYLAALLNGTIGHALDYDDLSFTYGAHPSVTLAPAVLSLGESTGAPGRDVLIAYIVGFEVGAYISSPVAQRHYIQGWHSTGTIGIMGATAAAAKLLKLGVHQAQMALGIAASMAGGLRKNFGTMTKPLHAGRAAGDGVLAAQLASHDFTANEDILEGPTGYASVLGCDEKIDWEKNTANLGNIFLLPKSRLGFKPYPSCGGTLGVIDASLYLKRKYNPDVSLINKIVLGVGPFENRTLIHHPQKGLEGKFSMEYCSCRALVDGAITLRSFSDEQINQPEIRKLMKRIRCVERYPMATMGADTSGLNPQSVTIRMIDGKEYFRETPLDAGLPVHAMSNRRLEEKYADCASLVLDENRIRKSLSLLRHFNSLRNIHELMDIVTEIQSGSSR